MEIRSLQGGKMCRLLEYSASGLSVTERMVVFDTWRTRLDPKPWKSRDCYKANGVAEQNP
jgi:hypothetical protein